MRAHSRASSSSVGVRGTEPRTEELIECTTGDVRIAGRFKGDVCVDGNFRIDSAGRLEGQVTASGVVIGGELQGNIDAAKHVELLTTGVIVGDVKATSLTVAAGCRMRGHVEFGWDDRDTKRTARQA